MSIATALSGLRKRERAIRTALVERGYQPSIPYNYSNDTSAIISTIGGIQRSGTDRRAIIKTLANKASTSAIYLPNGVLDFDGVYTENATVDTEAFADLLANEVQLPATPHLSILSLSSFARSKMSSVHGTCLFNFDPFDPTNIDNYKKGIAKFNDKSQQRIMSYAFASCVNLLEAPYFADASAHYFDAYAFRNCARMSSLGNNGYYTLGLGNYLFANCSSLKTVDLADFKFSNFSVGTYMYYQCTNLVSAYHPFNNFSTQNYGQCPNLSVIVKSPNSYPTQRITFSNNMLNGCTNLLCVDCSHLGIGNPGSPTLAQITAGNNAKWVFSESMMANLSGTWVSNTTVHKRILSVQDPIELVITYKDGHKFEFSFAQLSTTQLCTNGQGLTATGWLSTVRPQLEAYGPLSDIVEISASPYFTGMSRRMFQIPQNKGFSLSAVYLPFLVTAGTGMGQPTFGTQDGMFFALTSLRVLDERVFPNLVNCDGMNAFEWNIIPHVFDRFVLPKAKRVVNPLGGNHRLSIESIIFPEAETVGWTSYITTSAVYAPKLRTLYMASEGTAEYNPLEWLTKLSGTTTAAITEIETFDSIDASRLPDRAMLSNVTSVRRLNSNTPLPNIAAYSGTKFPKIKALYSLYFASDTLGDTVSGMDFSSLEYLQYQLFTDRLSGNLDVELPSLKMISADLFLNGTNMRRVEQLRHTPALINIKLPNLLSVDGIAAYPYAYAADVPIEYPDSQVSLILDFSGKTAKSADGKVHPVVLTLANSKYSSTTGSMPRSLSGLVNMYKSVKIIFDRELSAEVLEDRNDNHWLYNRLAERWPEEFISCYTFV